MKAVLQRVSRAAVFVSGQKVARIGTGLVVFLGVEKGDGPDDAEHVARKIAGLRVFEDDTGRMNRSLKDVGGEVLMVSQFTIAGSIDKGRRPSFDGAMPPEPAAVLFDHAVSALRQAGVPVKTGVFQAMMQVELVNEGPATFLYARGGSR